MVCDRCIKVVSDELNKLNYNIEKVELGEAIITSNAMPDIQKIKQSLEENGFELIDSRKANLVEQIKILVINLIHHDPTYKISKINLHKEITEITGLSYQYISSLFSSMVGCTIEKYIINQKVEKVKELIVYDELTLSEIAYRLGYSSVQHLSNQFKKITGLSPSYFRSIKNKKRKAIDKVI